MKMKINRLKTIAKRLINLLLIIQVIQILRIFSILVRKTFLIMLNLPEMLRKSTITTTMRVY